MNGLTLQLIPWKPYFEQVFTKLMKTMVWLKLHNLLVELWDGESLESIIETIGRLMKMDVYTSLLSRARFARVCLDIDLGHPLKRILWIEDDDTKVFVMIPYEQLPKFCFVCGLVDHRAHYYNHRSKR